MKGMIGLSFSFVNIFYLIFKNLEILEDLHQLSLVFQATKSVESLENRVSVVEVAELKRALLDFEKAFDSVPVSADPDSGLVKPLAFLTELYNTAGITRDKYGMLALTLDNLTRETGEKDELASVTGHVVGAVQKFVDLLSIAFTGSICPLDSRASVITLFFR
jgi:hypothetical protein